MNSRRTSVVLLSAVAAVATLTALATLAVPDAGAATLAGSQGTDTALPATDSVLTVNGRGQYAGLAITVNQTAKLTNQAVSVTWTGGEPTIAGPGRFGSHYLQLMQCWGDDDGSVPGNPGPPPEHCVQGAVAGTYGGLPGGLYPSGFSLSRVISRSDWPNFDSTVGHLDTRTTNVWLPFRAVSGTVVDIQTDPSFNPSVVGGNFWLNPYFNLVTTNEIAGGVTGPDGTGAELMQLLTGVQSSGLGCGQKVQPVEGAEPKIPKCWIVIVPRGSPSEENVGTPFAEAPEQYGVATSPLSPTAWANRIAIPIEFNPVDSPCSLADQERRIAGSETALTAVASWQPALCSGGTLPPYSYAPISDASARQQLVSGTQGAPGMIVVSRPLSTANADPHKPVVYAPISLSGLVIGFNIERNPRTDAPADEQQLAGVRVAQLNLTPRLVAKLLTQSYREQVTIQQSPNYPWMAANPSHMGLDPDFLRFNPEFTQLQIADGRSFSGLQLPAGNSDAALQVWEWLLADPEARAWLNGEPDEYGMKVNSWYSTSASVNPTGIAFGDPLPSSFPKADPYCYQAPARGAGNAIVPPLLCGTDWMPYSRSFADAALVTRTAAVGARIVDNPFAQAASEVWSRELPQFLGRRAILSLTDSPSAATFGLQVARLSRAGDNGAERTFIAADGAGLAAGVASMAPRTEQTFLEPAPTAGAPTAYPLTTLTYAAISPLTLDTQARSEYAAFIEYATGAGQVAGLELGLLPRGYAPLPAVLQTQAATAADRVRTLVDTPDPPATTTTVPRTVTTTPRRTTTTVATLPATSTTTVTATTVTAATTTTQVVVDEEDSEEPAPSPPTVLTPFAGLARSRYAVPTLGVTALGSALGALEITKRPRRRRAGERATDTGGGS
ncbi:MAG: hypothetical protein Q7V88_06235 [Actinomycetota bacterium]|nr:hypothetical protein [Actinomycetota bacterium]